MTGADLTGEKNPVVTHADLLEGRGQLGRAVQMGTFSRHSPCQKPSCCIRIWPKLFSWPPYSMGATLPASPASLPTTPCTIAILAHVFSLIELTKLVSVSGPLHMLCCVECSSSFHGWLLSHHRELSSNLTCLTCPFKALPSPLMFNHSEIVLLVSCV